MSKRGKIRWQTLEHSGPLFPEEYVPLPDSAFITYDGRPVKLNANSKENNLNLSAEECAYLYCLVKEQDERLSSSSRSSKRKKTVDALFNANFWNDWQPILRKHHPEIVDFNKIDFSNMLNYVSAFKTEKAEIRGMMLPTEKKQEKEEKEQIKEDFGLAIIDGQTMKIGNFRVQPPSLFIGHDSKLRGKIKKRIKPSEIIVNGTNVHGNDWYKKEIIPNVTYLAKYKNNVTNSYVYISLDRNTSPYVEESDTVKFDKARSLKENLPLIINRYSADIKSPYIRNQQFGMAVFFLDKMAIRPGTEKDETVDNDTVGLTTLKVSNIKLLPNNQIQINFFGKSSIEFNKQYNFAPILYERISSFLKNKKEDDLVFDTINAVSLNDYLKSIVPGLTAKVFRTWKASSILQNKLNEIKIDVNDSDAVKLQAFKKANIETARALNHKKLNQDNEQMIKELELKIEKETINLNQAQNDRQKEASLKKIEDYKIKLIEKNENLSTITSKVNYIDPRIVVAWAKTVEVPIEKIYNSSNLLKFRWAVETRSSWKF